MWCRQLWRPRSSDCRKDFLIKGIGAHVQDCQDSCGPLGNLPGVSSYLSHATKGDPEKHGNEGSPMWPCVVNNDAKNGKWLSCDLRALGFSIPACVEEGVSVVNWVYCVSRWLGLLRNVALDFLFGRRKFKGRFLCVWEWFLRGLGLVVLRLRELGGDSRVVFRCLCEFGGCDPVSLRVRFLGECGSSFCAATGIHAALVDAGVAGK